MALMPVNLFGMGLHADSAVLASENRINCFYDLRKTDTGTTIAVRGTPGSYPLVQNPVILAGGVHVVNNILYWVASDGTGLWSLNTSGTVTRLATGPVPFPYVQMADSYTQLMIIDGAGSGWIYTIASGVMTKITDANFPNCVSVCFISGRFVVEAKNTRQFYCSAAYDGLTWTYLSLPLFGTKAQASDPLFMVSSQNGILALIGTATIEFWQDVGASPVPFQYIQGSTQSYGTNSLYSVCAVNDSTFFMGQGPQGGLGVYSFKGYTVTKVSTTDVDDILADWYANGASTKFAHGLAYNTNGHDFYQLTDTTQGSLLYDATTGMWSRTQTDTIQNLAHSSGPAHNAIIGTVFNKQTVFIPSDGSFAIGVMNDNVYSDNGTKIQRQITTKRLRQNGNDFSITELVLQMDIGAVPLGTNYGITLEVSRDGGRTFGSPRKAILGLTGQYKDPRVRWTRLGSAREFVLRFTMTDPIPFTICGTEWELSVND